MPAPCFFDSLKHFAQYWSRTEEAGADDGCRNQSVVCFSQQKHSGEGQQKVFWGLRDGEKI